MFSTKWYMTNVYDPFHNLTSSNGNSQNKQAIFIAEEALFPA